MACVVDGGANYKAASNDRQSTFTAADFASNEEISHAGRVGIRRINAAKLVRKRS